MQHDDLIGRVIDDRYLIEAEIGEGGMGIVYRCRHVRLEKDSAIKILRRDHGHSEDVVGRFLKEARLASSIKHAHVVDLSDCGELPEGGAYYVMELLAGEALAETLERERRLPPADAFTLMVQVMDGLAAAHALEIVHRDLKPENVFLCETEAGPPHVKLLDFGIARAKDSKDTLPGTVLGTPEYMAPEQALGSNVDVRADLYALGVMLFELLTGRVPLYAADMGELLRLKLQGTPLRLTQGAPDLASMGFTERLIADLLARDPDDRISTIAEAKRRLLEAKERDLASTQGGEAKQTRGIGSGKLTSPGANTAYARAVQGGWQRPGTRLPSVGEQPAAHGLTVPHGGVASPDPEATPAWHEHETTAASRTPVQTLPMSGEAALPRPSGGAAGRRGVGLAVPLVAAAALLGGALTAVLVLGIRMPWQAGVDEAAPAAAPAAVTESLPVVAPAPGDREPSVAETRAPAQAPPEADARAVEATPGPPALPPEEPAPAPVTKPPAGTGTQAGPKSTAAEPRPAKPRPPKPQPSTKYTPPETGAPSSGLPVNPF